MEGEIHFPVALEGVWVKDPFKISFDDSVFYFIAGSNTFPCDLLEIVSANTYKVYQRPGTGYSGGEFTFTAIIGADDRMTLSGVPNNSYNGIYTRE